MHLVPALEMNHPVRKIAIEVYKHITWQNDIDAKERDKHVLLEQKKAFNSEWDKWGRFYGELTSLLIPEYFILNFFLKATLHDSLKSNFRSKKRSKLWPGTLHVFMLHNSPKSEVLLSLLIRWRMSFRATNNLLRILQLKSGEEQFRIHIFLTPKAMLFPLHTGRFWWWWQREHSRLRKPPAQRHRGGKECAMYGK